MELSTLLLTILTASVCLYYFVLNKLAFKLSYFKQLKIPHVRPVPLLGNMAPFVFQRMSHMKLQERMYNLFPNAKYFGLYQFMTSILVIRDPNLISMIAVKNFDNFCDHHGFINEILDPIAGKNLFDLRGDHWREMRKLLSPSFTSSKMKMMFGLMCQCAENLANFVTTQSDEVGKTYDMKDLICRYTNDTIATCAFGIDVDSFKYPNNEFFLLGREALDFEGSLSYKFIINRYLPEIAKFFKLRMFGSKIENFLKDIVATTVKARDEEGIVRPDMIQLMMENRSNDNVSEYDINEMTAQAFVFFLAGFDTVSSATCFITHEIGVNPDVQRKLKEEIDDVVKQSNGKPTYEAIKDMKYLDAVINETFRLYPIAHFLDRQCVKETEFPPATPDGKPITVKPGDIIWFPTFSLHRDPNYYPHPEKFDPDRFLNGSVDNSVYMPFGIGPRICIGNRFALMAIKVMLFYLLSNCNLEPDVKTRVPVILNKKSIGLTADGGFWLKLQARKSKTLITNGCRV